MSPWFSDHEHAWLAIGLLGQAMFSGRFLVQWLASERARSTVVPMWFWYLSIGGGTALLAYAIARQDPVFMLGQGLGLAIYFRNIALSRRQCGGPREKRANPLPGESAG